TDPMEPADEWEEGNDGPPAAPTAVRLVARTDPMEPADEWEEGNDGPPAAPTAVRLVARTDPMEPADEWEEGTDGPPAAPTAVRLVARTDPMEPADEWESFSRLGLLRWTHGSSGELGRLYSICDRGGDLGGGFACGNRLPLGGGGSGWLGPFDRDGHILEVDDAGLVELTVEGTPSRVSLFGADGRRLASDDGTAPGGGSRIALDLEPGTYLFRVESRGAEGRYTLRSTFAPELPEPLRIAEAGAFQVR
ncbi:MAG: hypothetical protein AAGD06_32130, partial [Acidobacteriota bacterium]